MEEYVPRDRTNIVCNIQVRFISQTLVKHKIQSFRDILCNTSCIIYVIINYTQKQKNVLC